MPHNKKEITLIEETFINTFVDQLVKKQQSSEVDFITSSTSNNETFSTKFNDNLDLLLCRYSPTLKGKLDSKKIILRIVDSYKHPLKFMESYIKNPTHTFSLLVDIMNDLVYETFIEDFTNIFDETAKLLGSNSHALDAIYCEWKYNLHTFGVKLSKTHMILEQSKQNTKPQYVFIISLKTKTITNKMGKKITLNEYNQFSSILKSMDENQEKIKYFMDIKK